MIRLPEWCLAGVAVAVMAGLNSSALASEIQGKLAAVFPDKQEILLDDGNGKSLAFFLEKDGKVLINNAESKLADLQPGEVVVVTHERQGQKLVASQIRCKRD
jgi:hypothetical protein